jgi:hypothetical protein
MNDARPGNANDASQPAIDSARETAVRGLAQQASGGSLTLDEYAERIRAVEQATGAEELAAVMRTVPEATAAGAGARGGRWLVAAFGGTELRGRWRLGRHLRVVAVLGGATLDLGAAQPEATESVITVVAVLGGAEIIVPQGVSIQLSGLSLFGGKSDKRGGGAPLPGSPLIRIRAFALLGGVAVKDRTPGKLIDLIRARRDTPTGD